MSEKQNNEQLPHWNPSEVEKIKANSNYLRGTLVESFADEATGSIAPGDTQLIKFHGSYQQTDRDLDEERRKQKLEPLFSFMIRARIPGGVVTADQWSEFDRLSEVYGNGTLKLTTRQAFQIHCVLKRNFKKTIVAINNVLLDTISGSGDVNRNVMCTNNEGLSPIVPEVFEFSKKISEHLLPKSTAYHEIWLDKKLVAGGAPDHEPIYGKTYLPRKFKIAIAIPPCNDTDLFSNDIGLIAIESNGELLGYNFAVGGGLGMTFGVEGTYPRLADVYGYVPKEKAIEVIEEIVKLQRDYGNRENRRLARLKYTIDRLGVDVFKQKLEKRLGWKLEPVRSYRFDSNGDVYGWKEAASGKWFLGIFVEHGRVKDAPDYSLKTGLAEVAKLKKSDFRLTGNQGLVIGNVEEKDKAEIEEILQRHNIWPGKHITGLRRNSIACVALNTCGLAFAEAERYLPSLNDKLDVILKDNDLDQDDILIRMTGCPNGCGRPYLGEIGFVGRAIGKYNLYLGAGFAGDRLNSLYKEMLSEEEILKELKPIIEDYANERVGNERFGHFVVRKRIVNPQPHVKILKG